MRIIEAFTEFRNSDHYVITHDRHFTYMIPKSHKAIRQGWKIHISATFENYLDIFKTVFNFATRRELTFKFLVTDKVFANSLSRNFDQTESGKFITIYPTSEGEFIDIITSLADEMGQNDGPYIFTDFPYRNSGNIFYRYGEIASNTGLLVGPNGETFKDIEGPYVSLPPFVQKPFADDDSPDSPSQHLDKDVFIDEAIKITNWGGVYAGHLKDNTRVIIKQARPFVGISERETAIDILKKEVALLQELTYETEFPNVIFTFYEWTDFFLVEEFIPGTALSQYSSREASRIETFDSQRLKDFKFKRFQTLAKEIINIINLAHEHGIVLQDIHPSNFIVTTDNEDNRAPQLSFVDLESSYYLNHIGDIAAIVSDFTDEITRQEPSFSSDWRRAAYIIVSFFSPANRLLNFDSTGQRTMLFFRKVCLQIGIPLAYSQLTEHIWQNTQTVYVFPDTVSEIGKAETPNINKILAEAKSLCTSRRAHKNFYSQISKYALSCFQRDNRGRKLEDLIANLPSFSRNIDQRISIRVRGEDNFYTPYIGGGNAGLIHLILDQREEDHSPQYDTLLYLLSRDLLLNYTKNPTFATGMSGIGFELVRLYNQLGDKYFLRCAMYMFENLKFFQVTDLKTKRISWLNNFYKTDDTSFLTGTAGIHFFIAEIKRVLEEEMKNETLSSKV